MKFFSMAEARANLAKLIDSAEQTHERVVITRNGEPAAVILGIYDYGTMQDQIELYSDLELQKEILAEIAYSKENPEHSYTLEQVKKEVEERRARESSDD